MTQTPAPKLPLLAVTLGDVAGIGPEITAKMLMGHDELRQKARLVVIGDVDVMVNAVRGLGGARRSPVSYTHLDVYKRQALPRRRASSADSSATSASARARGSWPADSVGAAAGAEAGGAGSRRRGCTLSWPTLTSTSNTSCSARCQVLNHSSGRPCWSMPWPSSISKMCIRDSARRRLAPSRRRCGWTN